MEPHLSPREPGEFASDYQRTEQTGISSGNRNYTVKNPQQDDLSISKVERVEKGVIGRLGSSFQSVGGSIVNGSSRLAKTVKIYGASLIKALHSYFTIHKSSSSSFKEYFKAALEAEKASQLSDSIQLVASEKEQFSKKMEYIKDRFQSHVTDMHLLKSGKVPFVSESKIHEIKTDLELGINYLNTLSEEAKRSGNVLEEALFKSMADTIEDDLKFINTLEKDKWGNYQVKRGVELLKARKNLDAAAKEMSYLDRLAEISLDNKAPAELKELKNRLQEGIHLSKAHVMEIKDSHAALKGGADDLEVGAKLEELNLKIADLDKHLFLVEAKVLGAEWKQSEHRKVLNAWAKSASGEPAAQVDRLQALKAEGAELSIYIDKASSLIEKGEADFQGAREALSDLRALLEEAEGNQQQIREEILESVTGDLRSSFPGSINPFFQGLQEDMGRLYSLTPSHVDKLEKTVEGFIATMEGKLQLIRAHCEEGTIEDDPVLSAIDGMVEEMRGALAEIESYRLGDIGHEWLADLFKQEEPSKLDQDIAGYMSKLRTGALSEYGALQDRLSALDKEDASGLAELEQNLAEIRGRFEKELAAVEGAFEAKESSKEPAMKKMKDDLLAIRESFHALSQSWQKVRDRKELQNFEKELVIELESLKKLEMEREPVLQDIKQAYLAWNSFKERAGELIQSMEKSERVDAFIFSMAETESQYDDIAETLLKKMNASIMAEADHLLASSSIEEYTAGDLEKLEKCQAKALEAARLFEEMNGAMDGHFDALHPLSKESLALLEKAEALKGKMGLLAAEVVQGKLKKGMFDILESSVAFSKLKSKEWDSAKERMIALSFWIQKAEERSAHYTLLLNDLTVKGEEADKFTPAMTSLQFMIEEARVMRAEAFRAESSEQFHQTAQSIESNPVFSKGTQMVAAIDGALSRVAELSIQEQEKIAFLKKDSVESALHDLELLLPHLKSGVAMLSAVEGELKKHDLKLSPEESEKKTSLEHELIKAESALHKLKSLRPPEEGKEHYVDASKAMGKEGRRISDKKTTGASNLRILEKQIERLIDDPRLMLTEKAGQLVVDKKGGAEGVDSLVAHIGVLQDIAKKCGTDKEFSDEGYASNSPVGLSNFVEEDLIRIKALIPKIAGLEWIARVGVKHPEKMEELQNALKSLGDQADAAIDRMAKRRVAESVNILKQCRAVAFREENDAYHVTREASSIELTAALIMINRMTEKDPAMMKAFKSMPEDEQKEVLAIKALLESGLSELYMAGKAKVESYQHLMLSLALSPKTALGQDQEEFATFNSLHLGLMNYDGLKKTPHVLFEAVRDAALLPAMTDEGRKELYRFVLQFYDGGLYQKAIKDKKVAEAVLEMAEYAKREGDSELVHLGNRIENALMHAITHVEKKSAPAVKEGAPLATDVLSSVRKKGMDSKRKAQAEDFAEALMARRQDLIRDMDFSDFWQNKKGKDLFWVGTVGKMIGESTNLSHFANLEIIKGKTAKERANSLEFFIEVAHQLADKGDYDSALAILGGAVKSNSVMRQKKTFSLLSKEAVDKYNALDTLFNPEKNSKNYNDAVRRRLNAGLPVIPYLGTALTMITFLGSRPDFNSKAAGQINQSKARKGAEILAVFEEAKKSKAPATLRIGGVQALLDGFPAERDAALSENKFGNFEDYVYKLSLEGEPRGTEPSTSFMKQAKSLIPKIGSKKAEGKTKTVKPPKPPKEAKPKKVPKELIEAVDSMKAINSQAGSKFTGFASAWNTGRSALAKLYELSGSKQDAAVNLAVAGNDKPVLLKEFIQGQGPDFIGAKLQSCVDRGKRVEADPVAVIEELKQQTQKTESMALTRAFGSIFLTAQTINQEGCKTIDKLITQAMNKRIVPLALYDAEGGEALRPEQQAWNRRVQEKLSQLDLGDYVEERLSINKKIADILRSQGGKLTPQILNELLAEVDAFTTKWEKLSGEQKEALAKIREEMSTPLPRFYVTNHPGYPGLIFDQDEAQADAPKLRNEALAAGIDDSKPEQKEAFRLFVQGKGYTLDEAGTVIWKTPSEAVIAQAEAWKKILAG